jgi:hypothetical protein
MQATQKAEGETGKASLLEAVGDVDVPTFRVNFG